MYYKSNAVHMITQIWDEELIALRDKATKSPGFFRPSVDPKNKAYPPIPDVPPGHQVSARIFPNGEFSVGYVPRRGISAKERRYDRNETEECRYEWQLMPDVQISPDGEHYTYTRRYEQVPSPKLGIGTKSSQRPAKYGTKGITSYGRKMLRNAGHVLDKACEGRYNRLPQMGTLTIPSYDDVTMERIAIHWSDIVRRFFQECKRQYKRYRYDFEYASCTEIQPQRYETRSEVGLHLHFLFVAIRLGKNKWVMPDSWVRYVWGNILDSYVGGENIRQLPNYRRDTVRQSSAAYLAKYASKGCDMVARVIEEKGEQYIPSQWWSISSGLRRAIRRHTVLSTGVLAEKLLVIARWGVSHYIRYIRCITLQTNCNEYAKTHNCPEEIVLGYGGLLSQSGYLLFSDGNQSEIFKECLPRTRPHNNRYTKKA